MRAGGLLLALCGLLTGCAGIPKGIRAVGDLDPNRYLGTWYEIARLDHRFERGLEKVSAAYSRRDDGGLRVVNSGWDPVRKEWRRAEGKAYFVDGPSSGRLRVSFFGPFYGGYNVIDLDREGYSWALVCGNDRSYLWVLARAPSLDPALVERIVARAGELGFRTGDLIFVRH
jgi:apolipoprotein D and lipocalin family protein